MPLEVAAFIELTEKLLAARVVYDDNAEAPWPRGFPFQYKLRLSSAFNKPSFTPFEPLIIRPAVFNVLIEASLAENGFLKYITSLEYNEPIELTEKLLVAKLL